MPTLRSHIHCDASQGWYIVPHMCGEGSREVALWRGEGGQFPCPRTGCALIFIAMGKGGRRGSRACRLLTGETNVHIALTVSTSQRARLLVRGRHENGRHRAGSRPGRMQFHTRIVLGNPLHSCRLSPTAEPIQRSRHSAAEPRAFPLKNSNSFAIDRHSYLMPHESGTSSRLPARIMAE